ncbi:MAG: hypothetical protein ACOYMA_14360 [Bacteroidia bacterium]
METEKTYNGVALLDKILEFIALTPNEKEWNYKSLSNNKPRQIRLQQINSLLKAFSLLENKNIFEKTSNYFNLDLRLEIKSIINGDFIKNRDLEEFNELTDFAKHYLQKNNHNSVRPIRFHELSFIYPKMIGYKIKLREIIGFNSGWLEASSTFSIFHIILTNSISSNLNNKYNDLDYVLELFINPRKLNFTEKELIEKFNFPTEDLHQIDMDNY